MTKTIEIQNVGPIEKLSIPVPEEGGVVVLRGANGRGKSTALETTQSLLLGKGKLDVRDGALTGGVNGLGATIRVGKATTRKGELQAEHLEGKLNVADMVDPGLRGEAEADAKRIRAIASLTGAKLDMDSLGEILGDLLDNYVDEDSTREGDLVAVVGKIKRDLQAAARRKEAEAKTHAAKAAVLQERGHDDADLPSEAEQQRRLQEAIRRESELETNAKVAADLKARGEQAKANLEQSESEYDGSSVEAATTARDAAKHYLGEAEKALARAQQEVEERRQQLRAAHSDLGYAQDHERMVAGWKNAIEDATKTQAPTPEELEAARAEANAARELIERAALAREAKAKREQAERHRSIVREAEAEAARCREGAEAVDELLTRAIQCESLRVVDGRLVTTTSRGDTYYHDLSNGEQWRIALDIAADQVGEHGLIVVPQAAWEGLDAANRKAIAEHARRREVVILTAEAQRDGETEDLAAEVVAK